MISLFIYYSFRPLNKKILKKFKNRTVSSSISVIAFVLPFILISTYFFFVLISNIYNLYSKYYNSQPPIALINNFEWNVESLIILRGRINDNMDNIFTDSSLQISDVVYPIIQELVNSLSLISQLFISYIVIIIMVFYLLRDDHKLKEWFIRTFGNKIPKSEKYAMEIDKDLQSVYFGNALTIFVVSFLTAFVFIVYNIIAPPELVVKNIFILSIICGVSSLLPLTGIKIIYIPLYSYLAILSISIGLTSFTWLPITMIIVCFIVIDLLPESIVRPYMSNRRMHFGLVILSYLLGVMLFGFIGLFLGPLLLVIIYNFSKEILPHIIKSIS